MLLTLEVELRCRSGQAPTRQDYADRFPAHRALIEEALSAATGASTVDWPATHSFVGKYRLIRSLGRGGQATTFLARDPDLQRLVVIKQYHRIRDAARRDAALNELHFHS